jgi:uncharacterized Zn finger protein
MAGTKVQEIRIAGGKIAGYAHKINELRRALASAPQDGRAEIQERLDQTLKTVAALRRRRMEQPQAGMEP